MSILSRIKTQSLGLPPRILILGVEGVGKSTFAAAAPSPLFLCPETGIDEHEGIPRFVPESYDEVKQVIADLTAMPEIEYKTLVIDTVDWLERMIHDKLCREHSEPNIEGTEPGSKFGYGKGAKRAEAELVMLLRSLDVLRAKHSMGILLVGHVHIKPFVDPAGESYDRWEAKGLKGFTGILREWPDACFFATFEVFTTKSKDRKPDRTIGGDRVMHTQWSPAWDAKNRFNLPPVLPLSYAAFAACLGGKKELIETIRNLYPLAGIEGDERKAWDTQMGKLETLTVDRLQKAVDVLREKVNGKE